MSKQVDLNIDRAQKALREFRRMQPGLSAYARAVTGKPRLRVEVTADAPHTDGTDIFFRPPIALADDVKHVRKLCDKRDPNTLIQRCQACAIREEILVTMYHEIAHVAYNSFAPFNDHDRKAAMDQAMSMKGEGYGKIMEQRLTAYKNKAYGTSFRTLAMSISEFLPDILNITEDIRIDEKMFRARKGIRRMREARARKAFTEGIEQADGSILHWTSAPLNSQFIVAMYAKSAGFEMEGFFHEKVLAAWETPKVSLLANAARVARSASDAFNIAFEILVEGKNLGFFEEESDTESESGPGETEDSSEAGPDNELEFTEKSESTSEGESDDEQPSEPQGSGDDSDMEIEPSSEADTSEADPPESREQGDNGDADSDGKTPESDEQSDSGAGTDERVGGEGSEEGTDSSESDSQAEPEDPQGEGEELSDHSGDDSESSAPPSDSTGDSQPGSDSGDDRDSSDDSSGSDTSESENPPEGEQVNDSTESSSSGSDSQDSDDESLSPSNREGDLSERESESESGSSTPSQGEAEEADRGDSSGQEAPPSNETSDVENEGDAGETPEHTPEPQDPVTPDDSRDSEPIESGAWDEEKVYEDTHEMGTADEMPEYIEAITGHHGNHESEDYEVADKKAMARVILAGAYFEKPPQNVTSVNIRRYDKPEPNSGYEDAWRGQNGGWISERRVFLGGYPDSLLREVGIKCDTDVPENILAPALQQTRRAFDDNARAKHLRNLKSGRVNGPSLAKRAPFNDPRMFKKSVLPGKKSYSVLIGIDISVSTVGDNIVLAKRAAKAQAELCQRAGIDFAVYAHTADGNSLSELSLEIYEIKNFREQWSDKSKEALDNIGAHAGNLDGHTIEYYRKMIEREQTTDKIILYYTDGKMPAANFKEELEVLQNQIKHCKRQGIALMGVGIRTDSPVRHGLETVQVDDDSDLIKVVQQLERKLVNR